MSNSNSGSNPLVPVLLILFLLWLLFGCSSTPYAKVGAGYKLKEVEINYTKNGKSVIGNHPISARFEVGMENEAWSYGLSHHSQYFSGAPFNSDGEYSKTELFIDYKFTFK